MTRAQKIDRNVALQAARQLAHSSARLARTRGRIKTYRGGNISAQYIFNEALSPRRVYSSVKFRFRQLCIRVREAPKERPLRAVALARVQST